MSRFVTQIKGAAAMGQTDINRVSETVLIPLFKEVFGFKDLKNLNRPESAPCGNFAIIICTKNMTG
jgi:hypothetical protein